MTDIPLISLKEWDALDIRSPNPLTKENYIRMTIVGPSEQGKSTIFKHLAMHKFRKQYETFVVFCGSNDTLKEYKEILDTDNVYNQFNPEILKVIKKKNEKLESEGKPMISVMCVYDDFGTRKNKNEESILDTFIQGRHHGMSICMILHDLILLDRISRDQFTHLILVRQSDPDVYEGIVEKYLLLPAMDDDTIPKEAKKTKIALRTYLMRLMSSNTVDYYSLVFMLSRYKKLQTIHIQDVLLKFKADVIKLKKDEKHIS